MSGDTSEHETEWFIHRLECPICGATTRADRIVKCYQCGSEMDHIEKVGQITDVVNTDNA